MHKTPKPHNNNDPTQTHQKTALTGADISAFVKNVTSKLPLPPLPAPKVAASPSPANPVVAGLISDVKEFFSDVFE